MPAAHAPSSPPASATPSPSTLAWPSPPSSSAPPPPQLCSSPVSAAAAATVPLAHECCLAWIRQDPDRTGLGTNSAGAVVTVDCAQPSSRTALHRRWVGLRLLPVPVDVMWLASRRHVCPVCVRRALRTSPWNAVPVVTFSAVRRDLPSPPTRFTTSSKSKMGVDARQGAALAGPQLSVCQEEHKCHAPAGHPQQELRRRPGRPSSATQQDPQEPLPTGEELDEMDGCAGDEMAPAQG